MNVGVGSLRLRFRGLSESPTFTGHGAVFLPFDTYHLWTAGEADPRRHAELHLRARLELGRAAAAGATIGFVYEDCFAHYTDPGDLEIQSLGAMVLGELGLTPAPLPGPEDRFEVLAPAFSVYLRRFGIAESFLRPRDVRGGLHPLCRTGERQLTGVAVPQGKGNVLFLPGDPRNRFLEFFTSLGEAVQHYRSQEEGISYVFEEEQELLERRNEALLDLERIENRLDLYRRRRRLLELIPANPQRRLPEWFVTFMGIGVRAAREEGVFLLADGEPGPGPAQAILAVSAGSGSDALLALQASRAALTATSALSPEAPAILYLATEECSPEGAASRTDLRQEGKRSGLLLLRPEDLLRFLDSCPDPTAGPIADLVGFLSSPAS
jgi:hypothetical protein